MVMWNWQTAGLLRSTDINTKLLLPSNPGRKEEEFVEIGAQI